jgi:hypothetical protein
MKIRTSHISFNDETRIVSLVSKPNFIRILSALDHFPQLDVIGIDPRTNKLQGLAIKGLVNLPDTLGLLWPKPDQDLEQAINLIAQICRILANTETAHVPGDTNLYCRIRKPIRRGYSVHANLGLRCWQELREIQSDPDQCRLHIQESMQDFWNATGHPGQSTRLLFSGTAAFQLGQPGLHETCITGSQITDSSWSWDSSYELSCHNTDTAKQAYGHVLALCHLMDYLALYRAQKIRNL